MRRSAWLRSGNACAQGVVTAASAVRGSALEFLSWMLLLTELNGEHSIYQPWRGEEGPMKLILVALGVLLIPNIASADSKLPFAFVSDWYVDQYNTYTITPTSFEGPGFECNIKSVTSRAQDTFVVDMTCAIEDSSKGGPTRALMSLHGGNTLIIANVTEARIDVMTRR
jgi:hypothetical protein